MPGHSVQRAPLAPGPAAAPSGSCLWFQVRTEPGVRRSWGQTSARLPGHRPLLPGLFPGHSSAGCHCQARREARAHAGHWAIPRTPAAPARLAGSGDAGAWRAGWQLRVGLLGASLEEMREGGRRLVRGERGVHLPPRVSSSPGLWGAALQLLRLSSRVLPEGR